jgi:hypothetical protein
MLGFMLGFMLAEEAKWPSCSHHIRSRGTLENAADRSPQIVRLADLADVEILALGDQCVGVVAVSQHTKGHSHEVYAWRECL